MASLMKWELFGLCHSILIQDARCHVTECCKICAWLLTDEQEENPVTMYQELQRDPQCHVWLFSFFHKLKLALKGKGFDAGYTCQVQSTQSLKMLPTVAQSLDSLDQVARELLLSWEHERRYMQLSHGKIYNLEIIWSRHESILEYNIP